MPAMTQMLEAAERGDARAAEDLLPLLYDELRQIAARQMALEKPGLTLNATALVHEAYLRLVNDGQASPKWQSRGHFVAAAAEAMRRILIESARRKGRIRHGGEHVRQAIDVECVPDDACSEEMLAINEALERFIAIEPEVGKLVKLRYFVGLTIPEAAAALGVSPRTADAWWSYARAWLFDALKDAD